MTQPAQDDSSPYAFTLDAELHAEVLASQRSEQADDAARWRAIALAERRANLALTSRIEALESLVPRSTDGDTPGDG